MIILKPTDDENLIKEYYQKENIAFSAASNLLSATERGEVLGYCLLILTTY